MDVRKLTSKDWKQVKEIRLEGLLNDPQSFCSTHKEESKHSNKFWKDWIKQFNFFGAFEDKKIIGIVMYHHGRLKQMEHIAYIWGFYVTPLARGKRVGESLLKKAIAHMKQSKKVKSIKIEAIVKKQTALTLYKRCGFKKIGTYEKEVKTNNRYYDLVLLQRLL